MFLRGESFMQNCFIHKKVSVVKFDVLANSYTAKSS